VVVNVTALSALIPIPTFTPPPSNHPLPLGEEVEEETPLEFGGTNNGHTGGEVGTLVAGGQAAAQGETGWTSAGASFSSGNQSAHVPSAASNILWGAAAAAVLGMTLADWQRKREEEAAARLAAERANEVPDDVLARRRAKVMAKNQAQRAQESRWEAARQAQNAKPEIDEDTFMQKTYKKILSTANVIPGVSAWKEKQEEQAKQNAVSAARWVGAASVAQGRREEENLSNIACVIKPEKPKSWWQVVGDWFMPQADNVATLTGAAGDMDDVKHVVFTPQKNNNVSVSAPDLPQGTRLEYFGDDVLNKFDLPPGGNYASSTINTRTATGLIDDAVKGSSFLTAGATSLVTNIYEYGNDAENLEEFSNQTFENQEFWASTAVDTALSVVIGLVAAGIVAGVVTFLGVATAPLWMTIGAVAIVSIVISGIVGYSGLPDTIDANANMLIDDLQGE
jgi:hypothetical protein